MSSGNIGSSDTWDCRHGRRSSDDYESGSEYSSSKTKTACSNSPYSYISYSQPATKNTYCTTTPSNSDYPVQLVRYLWQVNSELQVVYFILISIVFHSIIRIMYVVYNEYKLFPPSYFVFRARVSSSASFGVRVHLRQRLFSSPSSLVPNRSAHIPHLAFPQPHLSHI
ncbi:hypothetical protein BJ165DRAFT_174874 [Panaeolus papilionaceus]|nr:hypothetical protein BJ165DRAFT_174874 [Panaeolus papilionaceus]